MDDLLASRLHGRSRPGGDELDALFAVLTDNPPIEWAKAGDPAADLDALCRRLDALAFFPPVQAGV